MVNESREAGKTLGDRTAFGLLGKRFGKERACHPLSWALRGVVLDLFMFKHLFGAHALLELPKTLFCWQPLLAALERDLCTLHCYACTVVTHRAMALCERWLLRRLVLSSLTPSRNSSALECSLLEVAFLHAEGTPAWTSIGFCNQSS